MKTVKIILFFNLTLIVLCINSCSDDPVSNDPAAGDTGIDTVAMYEWSWDTISGHLLDNIYIVDSNNIFIVGNTNNMYYYNGETYNPIPYNDPTFSGRTITGYNQNNIFITGDRYVPPGPAKPCLKVWDGVSFTTYEFPNDSAHALGSVTVTGYNRGWCNTLNYIYYFDNGNFTVYYKSEIIGGGGFYISPSNEMYLFSSRIDGIYSPPAINTGYKYINNNFEIIYIDTSTQSTPMNNSYFSSKPFFFRGGHYTINIFENENWVQLCNTYNFAPSRISAASLDSVWCYGDGFSNGISFWLWNRNKWLLEKNFYDLCYGGQRIFPPSGPSSQMYVVDGKIYLIFDDTNINCSYLLKGKPIKRKEEHK